MEKIITPLLNWYRENKRELPWRISKDPYPVWISEIMLQQTRIEAVIGYYYRFLKEIPDIPSLAKIDLDKLLKLWEGLGYYNRVKNLQRAAKMIMETYHGVFPKNYEDILSLPGIGEYTASAIASICYDEKQVTVDGNVLRVYMRIQNSYLNVDDPKVKKEVRKELMKVIPKEAGDFNQGMMELGETICLPNGEPKCIICPLKSYCLSYQNKTVNELPVKNAKKEKQEEQYTILLFYQQKQFILSQRVEKGLLNHLWEFPNLKNHLSLKEVKSYLIENNIPFGKIKKGISYTHVFTHKKWHMISYLIEVTGSYDENWVTLKDLKDKAIPTAFVPFMNEIEEVINDPF